ncbi:unnamed protein product, partial [marine sediment metagenome]
VNNLPGTINFYDAVGMFKVGGTVRTTQEDLDNLNVISGGTSGGTITGTTFVYDFPYNAIDVLNDSDIYFGAQWLNLSMYFPQINWTFAYTSGDDRQQDTGDLWWKDYFKGFEGRRGEWFSVGPSQTQFTVASEFDARFMASAHALRTTFVNVSKEDVVTFSEINRKGLRKNDSNLSGVTLTGTYQYLPATGTSSQFNYGEVGYDTTNTGSPTTPNPFFFKGMYNANSIQLLFDFNFI